MNIPRRTAHPRAVICPAQFEALMQRLDILALDEFPDEVPC